jgi:leucyl-tRNA---protein transferase
MLVIQRWESEAHQCQYLPDREATLEYSYAPILSAAEYERLMDRGYRKFGPIFFRPMCVGCSECRPIRIPVATFTPDRSQRRAWKRNEHLEVRCGKPAVDTQRLELYQAYHSGQARRKGWSEKQRDAEDYEFIFATSPLEAVEITLWEGERLRAVVLTDITPNVVSGVYHFYDPDLYPQSIGTYCMLQTLELARRLDKRWAYFGFYVAGCGSLAYKANFRPCEIMDAAGTWQPVP